MTFANPQFLILGLILVPAATLFLYWASKQKQKAFAKLGDSTLIQRLSSSINWRGRHWQDALWLAALALLMISLARPQWGSEVREIDQEGLQVMIALDVSQSMLAEDIKPTRLDRAKLEIADLMERLDGDEVGIVPFSGASFVQVPLTSDYTTALTYLDSASPNVISRPGTVIGDAIRTAMRGFDPNLSNQKVLIVMTDGEDHETDPLAAAQAAASMTYSFTPSALAHRMANPCLSPTSMARPSPTRPTNRATPSFHDWMKAPCRLSPTPATVNTARATAGGGEFDALLDEIDTLQTAQLQSRLETRQIERFQIFLALTLLALVIAEFIPDRITQRASHVWTGKAPSVTRNLRHQKSPPHNKVHTP